jgi:geranylgeranyl diphosphate synthase type I
MTNQLSVAARPTRAVLTSYKQSINDALEKFFAEAPCLLALDLSAISRDALAKLQEYSLRPGKRIRGSLAAAAYDYAAKTNLGEAGIALGVALELMQSYLLIIDDVMDESDLRRGQPTVHQLYVKEADGQGDMHEATMLAINVGIVAQHLANLALLQAPEKPERITAALERMHVNIMATGFGQIDDLYQQVGRTVTSAEIMRKYCFKSSYYTFINPLQTGLALAGVGDEESQHQVQLFGEAAGIAFQLHDDLLGVFGDASATGKLSSDDIREGKYTALVYYALRHAEPNEVIELQAMLGNEHIQQPDVLRAREIFSRCGAKAFAQTETRWYGKVAKQQLIRTTIWDQSFKALLADMVDYSISRQS